MSKLIKDCGDYTTIPGNITHDKDLDLKSRGMLLTLLSLPDSWNFSEIGLVKIFNNEGRSSIRTALKKLQELGYLKRTRNRGVNGTLGDADYTVADHRCPEFSIVTDKENDNTEKSHSEKNLVKTPMFENRT